MSDERPVGPERPRLFVAVELPAEWRGWLCARAEDLERQALGYARWVAAPLLHLTLVFLGEQPAERLASITAALATAAVASRPFALTLGGLGSFGGGSPRVVWAAARAAPGALETLHLGLTRALQAGAVDFDARPLVPHVTLGRARRGADSAAGRLLARRLAAPTAPSPPPAFTVAEIALIRSVLGPGGPKYTPLERFALGGANLRGGRGTPA